MKEVSGVSAVENEVRMMQVRHIRNLETDEHRFAAEMGVSVEDAAAALKLARDPETTEDSYVVFRS